MKDPEYQAQFDLEDTHWWFAARREFAARLCAHIGIHPGKRRTIVDVGAGTGGMVSFLRRYGHVVGIEPNCKGRRLACRRGITLCNGTAENTGYPTSGCDMVCFFDVLYHKGIDDRKALQEAYRMLRPGGWLLITDCAMPWLAGPHDRAVEGRKRYMLSEMVQMIEDQGFMIRKKTYTFFVLFPLFALKRMTDWLLVDDMHAHSDVRPVGRMLNYIMAFICRIEGIFLPFVSFPWGSSIFVLARKDRINDIPR